MPSTKSAPTVEEGQTVYGVYEEHVGETTGGTRRCGLTSCTGRRIATRWENGNLTYPCEQGMEFDEESEAWYITPRRPKEE